MIEGTYHFTNNFLWGTATAAHQVEGQNTNNNWYAWENEPGRIIDGHKAGLACDWWGGRWREDFDRAAETGQNTHRMSIEWSRIQPKSDRWDEQALDHYRQMVRGLVERGLKPMVTLHHFSDPLWIYETGGWTVDRTEAFTKFTEKVVTALKEYVSFWTTINEPNVYATQAYVTGDFPPAGNLGEFFKVIANLARAHTAAYHKIHEIQPEAVVGIATNYRPIIPASRSPLDKWVANLQSSLFNDFFNHAAATGVMRFPWGRRRIKGGAKTQDFIGVNYYTQDYVKFSLAAMGEAFGKRYMDPDAPLSPTGFIALQPKGFYTALKWANQFGLPIYVTENGVEDPDDSMRPRYLAEHLHQMWRAINFNWPIKGYYHWTLVDNFEWERGWTQRFGLWGLDVESQARIKRPSVDFYAEICKTNALSSSLIDQYAPKARPALFPQNG